jgi:hypothetical protein
VTLREDPEKGVFLHGASVYRADTEAQSREIIEYGNEMRNRALCDMGVANTGRSNSVLCVTVSQPSAMPCMCFSRLRWV